MTKSIIAVAGASASGKSLFAKTVAHEVQQELGEQCSIALIQEDSYYKDQSHLPLEQRAQTNYDHPNAFEHELLLEHLRDLHEGKTVEVPVYDYTIHTRSDETRSVSPADIIIVEGILLLHDPKLIDVFDLKIFMDTPLDICLLRRIQRDTQERGRTFESVTEQYLATVRPMYEQFIALSKNYADIIVPQGGQNRYAIDLVKNHIHAVSN